MLLTWIYMMVDKGFFTDNGVEYSCALGETDIQLFSTYDDACRSMDFREKGYRQYGYEVKDSGNGTDGDDLVYWARYENEEGRAHVFEIRRKIVYGDLFQADLS